MSSNESTDERSAIECPACGKCFLTARGMKSHHLQVHDEAVVGGESRKSER
ncbi:C2H2-type zinc finger protein [Halomarina pelagica]|uniref:C2H2-type zinc finger protein n=1 Tax=Halomarina pelagica TaxID=2961599 RepID=UPI0020C20C1C|nr:C2H2-type zinc finger protein [Halomarina sp. BND7]